MPVIQVILIIIMTKLLLAFLLLLIPAYSSFIRSHQFWFTAGRPVATKENPSPSDDTWNYCDLRCLYLERYYPMYDFCFIIFSQTSKKPDFGACYVVKSTA